jgi:hypothetical protein
MKIARMILEKSNILKEPSTILNESTRSFVGIEDNSGKIKYIYVHYDGYLKGLGKTLLDHYADEKKIKKMISLGDASSIGKELEPEKGQEHTFNNPIKGVSVFYKRDRGEKGVDASGSSSRDTFRRAGQDIDYLYLYIQKEKEWYVLHGKSEMTPLRNTIN